MPGKANFSNEEWAVLSETPHVVAMAVTGAGGGIFGAMKEMMAGMQAMAAGAQSGSQIVQQICSAQEIQAAAQRVQGMVMKDPTSATPEKLLQLATHYCGQAAAILADQASGDLEEYSAFVLGVAEEVAKASKEGGFLGFGGQQVSEGEVSVLDAVSAALQGRGGLGAGLPGGVLRPPVSSAPQAPSAPARTPAESVEPAAPARSNKMPGLQPKSSQPGGTPVGGSQPSAPAGGASSTPGLKPSKSVSKGGFKSSSGLKKKK
jgi:hypothetical protein